MRKHTDTQEEKMIFPSFAIQISPIAKMSILEGKASDHTEAMCQHVVKKTNKMCRLKISKKSKKYCSRHEEVEEVKNVQHLEQNLPLIDPRQLYRSRETFLVGKGKQQWICQGVDTMVVSWSDSVVKIQCLDLSKHITLTSEEFNSHFFPIRTLNNIDRETFETKQIPKKVIVNLFSHLKSLPEYSIIKKIIDKIHQDAYHSPGNTKNMTIPEYREYQSGNRTQLERFSPIFNRRVRWTNISNGKGVIPNGIDEHEHASLSECNLILKSLVLQLSMIVADTFHQKVSDKIKSFCKDVEARITNECRYCKVPILLNDLNKQTYGTTVQIHLCHENPHEGTNHKNLYLGHSFCNQKQGSNSILDMMREALCLFKTHSSIISLDCLSNIVMNTIIPLGHKIPTIIVDKLVEHFVLTLGTISDATLHKLQKHIDSKLNLKK